MNPTKKIQVSPPRIIRWAFKTEVAEGIRRGEITKAVRRAPSREEDRPRIGDRLEAFRWHGVRAGVPVDELGAFVITEVHEFTLFANAAVGVVPPQSDLRRFARETCGFESWAALVRRALGKRNRFPAKGIRLVVVHWKGGAL